MLTLRKRPRLAIAALPVLALALLVSSRSLLRCDSDGIARAECCCATTQDGRAAPDTRLHQGCCCDAVRVGPALTTSALAAKAAPDARPILVAILGAEPPEVDRSHPAFAPRSERSSRPPGVPLFVLKRAFLI